MTGKGKTRLTVGFIALGCPKNIVDSEKMLGEIAEAGFLIADEPENADVIVINTCAFIAPAEAEALKTIKHAVDCKLNGTVKKVVVAGCLPQRLGEQLFSQTDGVDAIVGLGQRDNIARIINKTITADKSTAYLGPSSQLISDDRARLLITGRHWAYLRISEGCNHRCSFCTIPAIRGPFRSKPRQLVLAEADELASAGVVELNVIAQDTTYYGHDLKIKNGLTPLLKELETIDGIEWIRLMYLNPSRVNKQLIHTIAASERIVHYLDIPIQHINNRILKDMRRPDTKDKLQRLIENLRCAIADCVLRTTVIVGFPGETDQQFAELLSFIKWAEFDALGCFKFYPESGTTAAQMPAQIPEDVKEQRAEELMLTQQKIAFARNKSRIGSELTCLVDSVDNKGSAQGRFYGQAPEIDSICIIGNCSANPGQFVDVEVIGTRDYDLVVRQIKY